MNKTFSEPLTFRAMYYNALVEELIKVFTKESEQIGNAVQITIIYSSTKTDFIFAKKITVSGKVEARHVFPLNSETLMDKQLVPLFKAFYRIKNL